MVIKLQVFQVDGPEDLSPSLFLCSEMDRSMLTGAPSPVLSRYARPVKLNPDCVLSSVELLLVELPSRQAEQAAVIKSPSVKIPNNHTDGENQFGADKSGMSFARLI